MAKIERKIERWTPDPATQAGDLATLANLLHACVHQGASVSFILPFSHHEATLFWRDKVLPGVKAATSQVLLARIEGRIVGTVQLDFATPPNQTHRAEVKKLLVHPDARRQGIARALMIEVENEARKANRTLLTLDTRTGDSAEPLYRSLGYIAAGIIPRYARRPDAQELEDTTLMYKELAP